MSLRGRNFRGFPFDEEEGSDAWSDLLVRHPELAARLRPSSWGRKRRPSSQDGVDDSGDNFGGFDRFPFNSIPPEFRDHFPSQWSDFAPREEQRHQPPSPQHQTTSTQTETEATPTQDKTQAPLPQYGLRNTVDLGQKSPADPSLVDAEDRAQRSMSAPPGHHIINPNIGSMSGQGNQEATTHQTQEQHSNVRHIPIFVEGRDEPVINKNVDHGTHFAEAKPSPHPPHPHVDREQYYTDDGPAGFPFPKSFDRPFFRQGAQPFTKQKMYPQAAFARGTSPQRSQSPKPSFHEQHVPRAETPSKPQQKQTSPHQKQSQPQFNNQNHHQQHATQPPPQTQSPPPPPQPTPPQQPPSANDPISRILSIQTDVLNLMTDVENFTGTKKDKRYIYLDEMLTRNLIKLDNIETDGKENIRQARKEAIKCIQKCIAVLEAKADNKGNATPQSVSDVEMQVTDNEKSTENSEVVQNGDIEMKEPTKELSLETENQNKRQSSDVQAESSEIQKSSGITAETSPAAIIEEIPKAQEVDTQPSDKETDTPNKIQPEGQESTEKKSPKKTVKKRDKSKDTKKTLKDKENKNDEPAKGDARMKYEDESVDNKGEQIENIVNINDNEICVNNKVEGARVNDKSDKKETRSMEVDGAASQ